MEEEILLLLDEALGEDRRLVEGVGPGQWDAPTPCSDWSVRDLVNHMVAGNRYFAAVVRGESADRALFAENNLGENPGTAYRDAALELSEAFRMPGAFERTYSLPIGALSGPAAATLRLVETIAHGWDLGRATGQTPEYSPSAVQAALAFSERTPTPTGRGGPFARPTEPDAKANDLDRLAARLGRETQ